jgi:DNA-3-methyladenine glycosylase
MSKRNVKSLVFRPRKPKPRRWQRLTDSFYERPTVTVARDLIGRYLVHNVRGRTLAGKIVEVAAYRGPDDAASHAYRGRTTRNDVMFRRGGHLYVYFTYGMHHCANVVTGREGKAGAVLLRAVEPLAGIAALRRNRQRATSDQQLTNGPAKLCEAFALTKADNGIHLTGPEIFLTKGDPPPRHLRARSTRVGITNGQERQWRFFVRGNPWVSARGRPNQR